MSEQLGKLMTWMSWWWLRLTSFCRQLDGLIITFLASAPPLAPPSIWGVLIVAASGPLIYLKAFLINRAEPIVRQWFIGRHIAPSRPTGGAIDGPENCIVMGALPLESLFPGICGGKCCDKGALPGNLADRQSFLRIRRGDKNFELSFQIAAAASSEPLIFR